MEITRRQMTTSEQGFTGTCAWAQEDGMQDRVPGMLWEKLIQTERQPHSGTQEAAEKEVRISAHALPAFCFWLADDLHMHIGFICSLLLKRPGVFAAINAGRHMPVIFWLAFSRLEGKLKVGSSQQLLYLVINGNCFTKNSLHSEENLDVRFRILTDLSQVTFLSLLCDLPWVSLFFRMCSYRRDTHGSGNQRAKLPTV